MKIFSQMRRKHWNWLSVVLSFASGIGLVLAFQASTSGLRIARHTDEWDPAARTVASVLYVCDGKNLGFTVDSYSNLSLSNGKEECPSDAKAAAIVTSDKPWLLSWAIGAFILSTAIQMFFATADMLQEGDNAMR